MRMNRRALTIFAWISFIISIGLLGWFSGVLTNHTANFFYEAGAIFGGTILIIVTFVVFNTLLPRRSRFLPWLLLAIIIFVFAYAKIGMDSAISENGALDIQTIPGVR